jgi:hypothetical protein
MHTGTCIRSLKEKVKRNRLQRRLGKALGKEEASRSRQIWRDGGRPAEGDGPTTHPNDFVRVELLRRSRCSAPSAGGPPCRVMIQILSLNRKVVF